jgi:hypothetical protein
MGAHSPKAAAHCARCKNATGVIETEFIENADKQKNQ